MIFKKSIEKIVNKDDLSLQEMSSLIETVMTGKLSEAQVAAILVGMRIKGETVAEITAAARVMRKFSAKVLVPQKKLLDTCGTGGDSSNSFNISTASAFVTAAADIPIAKHGNRSASSNSGSADLLEHAGCRIDLNENQVSKCITEIGIGFMFAPMHHSALKQVSIIRKQLGLRTMFNVLGPLTNPADASYQLIGVYHESLVNRIALVLRNLGCERAMVVCSKRGMDEIALDSPTIVSELKHDKVMSYEITPDMYGMKYSSHDDIRVDDPIGSLKLINDIFDGNEGLAADIVTINAGAAIYLGGKAETIQEGRDKAVHLLKSGKVRSLFHKFIELTNSFD